MAVELRLPSLGLLPDYVQALERGWSSDNLRGKAAADEQLVRIAADPQDFIASLDDQDGRGPPVTWVDGTTHPRLPGINRWIWDGGFCGSIAFRWWGEGDGLPDWFPYGHIGYAVPEWKRQRGYATAALRLILQEAKARGLTSVELTTDEANPASQGVVLRNGGQICSRESGGPAHSGADIIRWRIPL